MSDMFDDVLYHRIFKISGGRVDLLDESTRELLNVGRESTRSCDIPSDDEGRSSDSEKAA